LFVSDYQSQIKNPSRLIEIIFGTNVRDDSKNIMNELIHFSGIRQSTRTCRRFSSCSISEKILYTSFLLVIGAGYLVALANMYCTYEQIDGIPGFSVDDIAIKYHGSQHQTRLGTAINGIMEPNLKNKSDKELILKWIQSGAIESEYNENIAPIINRDCVTCHAPSVNPALPDLTNYKTIAEVAKSGATPLPALLRVAHIHLFGIAFILVFIGKIFLLCEMHVIAKRILVALPFMAAILDIASWFATRTNPDFAYAIVAFGALMGFSIGFQILASIYQMWFSLKYKYSVKSAF
jgi:hypothetical protein